MFGFFSGMSKVEVRWNGWLYGFLLRRGCDGGLGRRGCGGNEGRSSRSRGISRSMT